MSRRSNKTAHVLGLITSGKDEEVNKEIVDKEAANTKTAATEVVDREVVDVDLEKNQPLRDLPISPKETEPEYLPGQAASETTRDNSIKQSIISPDSTSNKAPIVKILFKDHDPLSDLIRDQLEAGEFMAEATREEKTAMSEENKKDPIQTNDKLGVTISKDPVSNKVTIRDQDGQEDKELDYKYLNVSEELVREKVIEVMENIGTCTCDRCIVDTVALAVTNMPAKCVVADKDAIFPLLSYYRSKFATAVHTELMKAAILIKDNPHH